MNAYLFEVPGALRPLWEAGRVTRYGAILKDAGSGQIVGHLKEVGNFGAAMASLPVNPLSTAVNVAGQVVQNAQLAAIRQTLDAVQLLSSVSAVASVANLGVSVAGFAVVLTKLQRMDGKLDAILKELDAVKDMVRQTNFTLDAVQLSELRTAADCLGDAESASDPKNRRRLLSDAAVMFRKQRHYYAQLLERAALWEREDVPVSAIVEAHARYVAVGMGELQAVFLQGDMGAYRNAVRAIAAQHAPFARLDAGPILRARSEAAFRRSVEERIRRVTPGLANELGGARALLLEDHARVETMTADADYVEGNRLDAFEWFAEQKRREPGIAVLVAPRYSQAA